MTPNSHRAFGHPGLEPRWTTGAKDGIGTAPDVASRIWFTVWNGILTEVYWPTVDRPQLRDLQLLVTDGASFFHEEQRDLASTCERLSPHSLGYRCTNADPEKRYTLVKELITDPERACVLQRTHLLGDESLLSTLRLYVLCAPHLDGDGWGNSGYVMDIGERRFLMAEKHGTWLALTATVPIGRASCGYAGRSDGWTDLADNFTMDWEFDHAPDGNIALMGALELSGRREFTIGLAFGESRHHAITTLLQALGIPFAAHHTRYKEHWDRASDGVLPLAPVSGDKGHLYHGSVSVLLGHEDKSYRGALIASLSIPWGDAKGDEARGYHLVWTRDMINSASGLLAAGNTETPLRALIYLAASQQADGGFPQNFWIDGTPYRQGIQLDEVTFPILLAWHLKTQKALQDFDPYPMVRQAAGYLIRHGPVTQQERWEEAGGYSPSTLASNIAALIIAACLARERQDEVSAQLLEVYADFLERHLEEWTVTTEGTLVPDITRHYIRILPADVNNPTPSEDPNQGMLTISNRPPGTPHVFPAKEVVDAGFLELVRYGIRKPDDPLIVESLRVIDAMLKVETPLGPCWHRYNHDGYGQRDDGGPFVGGGTGRGWPLLAGERGHYELAAGHNTRPILRAMEAFASPTGLLPEQVWDAPDRPDGSMRCGRPTGSAMPLLWAHAEYIKLLRSVSDGHVFDLIPEVAHRYLGARHGHHRVEIWKPNRQVPRVKRGDTLRIQVPAAFRLHWSADEWRTVTETVSSATPLGIEFGDISIGPAQRAPIRFTFFWTEAGRWEGRDYAVAVV